MCLRSARIGGVEADVLIVGAGFAGAATAFHLSRTSDARVVVVDREEVPGYHASGRNASLVLQTVSHPSTRRMVAASVRAYLEIQDEIGYFPSGSILLGRREQLEKVRDPEVSTEWISPGSVRSRIPLLDGHAFDLALLTPTDGIMDVSSLLQFYLRGRTGHSPQSSFDCEVVSVTRRNAGFQVETSRGTFQARVVVNGAGAWANELAERSGAAPRPMKSFKRHLFILNHAGVVPQMPFVWSLAQEFYFRPESGGLLFSVCDEEYSAGPFVQTVNPDISETLAELISRHLPALEDASQRKVWSCFRTKTPTGDFHLGWDNDLEGFFWVAGLGGHGVGASWEIGRQAAEQILTRL